jgi:hypothetical protein
MRFNVALTTIVTTNVAYYPRGERWSVSALISPRSPES